MKNALSWEPLTAPDIAAVAAMAGLAHPALPERAEVFAEKAALFPAGCRKLLLGGSAAGYGIAHPWTLNSIPPLDGFLGALPERPECVYIHDVVVLPPARGLGAAGLYVGYLAGLAAGMKIPALALTAVYGSGALWSRFGFRGAPAPAGLGAYGPGAEYMILRK